ncbi:hypothetical protein JL04_02360 [Gallibacterium anatis]|nr:hypothetical protein JL04_02360 [Gallibacterium anatis]
MRFSRGALKIKRFLPERVAQDLTDKILDSGYHYYENAKSIGKIGMAFYEVEGDPERFNEYFDTAQKSIEEFRNRCFPLISPIDLVRCYLDETWLAGANIARLYGKKMFIGLSRVVEPNITFLAHHDILSKDAPDSFEAHSLLAQIACNIYLDVPNDGGDLHIWEKEMSPEEFDRKRGESYGIDPSLLGEPDVVVNVNSGDLVFFNSQKMHAVTSSSTRSRLSVSCFIGYKGANVPLIMWS